MCQLKRWVWICSLELKDLGKPCNSLHIVQFNLPRKTNTTCFSLTTLQFLYSRKHLSRKSRRSPIQLPTSAFNIISSFQYNLLYPVHLQPSPFYPHIIGFNVPCQQTECSVLPSEERLCRYSYERWKPARIPGIFSMALLSSHEFTIVIWREREGAADINF